MLTQSVSRQLETGIWVVAFHGDLTVAGHALIRRVLLKCAVECPTALILDIHGLTSYNDLVLAFLPALQRRVEETGVRLLCTADEALVSRMRAEPSGRFVRLYPTLHEARRAAERMDGPVWLHATLPAGPSSASDATDLLTESCTAWGIANALPHARLLLSELVDNAVRHGGAALDVTATLRGDYLYLRVHDRGRVRPGPRAVRTDDATTVPGTGGVALPMVDRYASAWGITEAGDGKSVWASLRVQPVQRNARPIVPAQRRPNTAATHRRPRPNGRG